MNISLPTPENPVRKFLGNISDVANILSPENRNKVANITDSYLSAKSYLESEDAVSSVYQIVSGNNHTNFFLVQFSKTSSGIDTSFLWQFC